MTEGRVDILTDSLGVLDSRRQSDAYLTDLLPIADLPAGRNLLRPDFRRKNGPRRRFVRAL